MTVEDDLYHDAVYYVSNDRKASTSYVQRKLQIGYNRAAALMERMEQNGVIGPCNHVGKRDILIGPIEVKPDVTPDDKPPFDPDPPAAAETEAPEPAPEQASKAETEPEAPYTGPMKRFTCDGCDCKAQGPANGLPKGWWTQTSGTLGTLFKCEPCAEKMASRIATEHLTTEQIMSAGTDGAQTDLITAAAQGRLKSFIERLERLFEDIAAIQGDAKDVKAEAKGEGFDVKVIMRVIRERRKDANKREEEETLFDLYVSAIGGL